MKTTLLTLLLVIPLCFLNAQQWQQLAGEPEGGGVTDIYADPESGDLYVATGSLNWPNGEDGGLRKSTNDGATWTNIFDAYTSRFIFRGPDGYLYASVWDYPANEGLYRSTNNGSDWNLLTSVPSGNNIFACAIVEGSTNTIFAGTGQGVYRSLDNGNSWAYANTGIPSGTLVRSMAVSPDGATIAAGTVDGLYVSTDNGDSWDKVSGDGENEIISSVTFDTEVSEDGMPATLLLFGSESGKIFLTTSITLFTVAFLCATIAANKGLTRILAFKKASTLVPIYLVSLYAALGGGFYYAIAGLTFWQSYMTGLPTNALISIFTAYLALSTATIVMYIAMYGNSSKASASGSEIYKATFDLATAIDLKPFANPQMTLYQNIPNPFREETRINFELDKPGNTSLKVFDLAGNEVKSLVNGMLNQGRHSIRVAADGLSSGIYYYVLSSGEMVETKKLVIQ